ncbi:MAG TPA: T9SS type A sorting domain-containing protein, partial [Saprospiraceae bacterium]|nr:T9SS type A sorting domain-containing protein [Saprospiraceae bacterium]
DNAPKYRALLDHIDACTTNAVKEAFSGIRLKIWPNPGSGLFRLSGESVGAIREIQVLNLTGQLLMRAEWDGADALDLSGLPPGAYFVRFSDGQHWQVEKAVVQKR